MFRQLEMIATKCTERRRAARDGWRRVPPESTRNAVHELPDLPLKPGEDEAFARSRSAPKSSACPPRRREAYAGVQAAIRSRAGVRRHLDLEDRSSSRSIVADCERIA